MLKTLSDLNKLLEKQKDKKKLVLAVAQDHHALDAAYNAYKKEIVEIVLVGKKDEIISLSEKYSYSLTDIQIIDEADKQKAVEISVKLVAEKKADILMKGNVNTSVLLKGVLNKEWGLRTGGLLSHLAIFEIKKYHKLLGLTDVAMNIAPDLKAKVAILKNAIDYMNKLGIEKPKVAAIAAMENVDENMIASLDAALLSKMSQRNQILNCEIDGPLAFDNAISSESAIQKGISSPVSGDADLLLMPNIESGNVLYKALSFFGDAKIAAVILGAKAPIVLTSRSDSEEAKLNSILLAAVSFK
ncbi:MAG: bifunctional enoyl-CoA hydratase/phosphate acetyltransferase [Bacteroidetes bacterium]|jgi:phosphate butyryltransferase|nr:bifunctional enoyl-CoA hydratase/phosphate acetyltransferase [Bacteroidota bacterium]MBT6686844.1 bifunctional enoyl-CoA hydratase/phosphate acetyltransferase [Bacteroidota bacterium]MBT7144173.1 bifunctional enoyl-CoA hydratase/phosphate acetyltransferase [Bacteroidota bacterium]MBT7491892.1 bifunctional enoyl-CoA hydratase/phosphate acetyltransferase [Bacteroidota bacterium]